MECTRVEQEEIIESYLNGALSPEDRDAFEMHCLGCAQCADLLQTYQAVQTELKESHHAYAAEAGRRIWSWRMAWLTAAVVLIAGGVTLWLWFPGAAPSRAPVAQIPQQPVQPDSARSAEARRTVSSTLLLAKLARFEPPAYIPLQLRGSAGEASERFAAAMNHYSLGDYQQALPGLREAVRLDPQAPQIRFFLGISELLSNQTDAGIATLRETIALGPSPYLEEAHFYLAKGHLKKGNIVAATEQLSRTILLHGRLEDSARQLLQQLQDRGPLN